jgi:hypothetical protein
MRKSLFELIEKTIIYKYDLTFNGVAKTLFSTINDKCYTIQQKTDLSEIIYNGIIEYSFNEFDISGKDYSNLHASALKTKIKYNPDADDSAKLKYGFFGEVLLYSILSIIYKTTPLIARGYFYNPLENSETKGYDSYHLIDNDGITELWFGEAKFHISHGQAIDSVMSNIEKALSDAYLERNVLAFQNQKNNFNIKGTKIETIIEAWEANPQINIANEIKSHNMRLVYPILLLYEEDASGYDSCIKKVPEYIVNEHSTKKFTLSVDHTVFFIIIPIKQVKEIKKEVISWIESKRPLMS